MDEDGIRRYLQRICDLYPSVVAPADTPKAAVQVAVAPPVQTVVGGGAGNLMSPGLPALPLADQSQQRLLGAQCSSPVFQPVVFPSGQPEPMSTMASTTTDVLCMPTESSAASTTVPASTYSLLSPAASTAFQRATVRTSEPIGLGSADSVVPLSPQGETTAAPEYSMLLSEGEAPRIQLSSPTVTPPEPSPLLHIAAPSSCTPSISSAEACTALLASPTAEVVSESSSKAPSVGFFVAAPSVLPT